MRENKPKQGTVNFYSYSETYSGSSNAHRILKAFTKPISPAYAHASLTVEGWVFSYSLSSYSMKRGSNQQAVKQIEVAIANPEALLKWENPKKQSLLLRLVGFPLSLVSRRFENCATAVGGIIGAKARTPDGLAKELEG